MPAAITVIIPTKNTARLLPEAVHSVLDQSRYVDEIIVIDHGTDAETPAIAQQLKDIMGEAPAGSSIARFHYQRTDKAGTGAAINTALDSAKGDYVWVIGAQNRALSHGAETLARLLDDAPDATFAAGAYRRFKINPRSRKQNDLAPLFWPDLRQSVPLRHLLENSFLPGDAVMCRRSALTDAGPFRENAKGMSHYDMQVRLACMGPVKFTEDPVFLQRMSDDSPKSTGGQSDKTVITDFRERIPL